MRTEGFARLTRAVSGIGSSLVRQKTLLEQQHDVDSIGVSLALTPLHLGLGAAMNMRRQPRLGGNATGLPLARVSGWLVHA